MTPPPAFMVVPPLQVYALEKNIKKSNLNSVLFCIILTISGSIYLLRLIKTCHTIRYGTLFTLNSIYMFILRTVRSFFEIALDPLELSILYIPTYYP